MFVEILRDELALEASVGMKPQIALAWHFKDWINALNLC